jgi:hypothetical protein
MSDDARDYKKFINTLRCPLCKAQLDGSVHPSRSILECRANPAEYSCIYQNKQKKPASETVTLYYSDYYYEMLVAPQADGQYVSIIDRYDLSFDKDKIRKSKLRLYKIPANMIALYAKYPTQEELLKKLKMYNLFS